MCFTTLKLLCPKTLPLHQFGKNCQWQKAFFSFCIENFQLLMDKFRLCAKHYFVQIPKTILCNLMSIYTVAFAPGNAFGTLDFQCRNFGITPLIFIQKISPPVWNKYPCFQTQSTKLFCNNTHFQISGKTCLTKLARYLLFLFPKPCIDHLTGNNQVYFWKYQCLKKIKFFITLKLGLTKWLNDLKSLLVLF